MGWSTFLWPQNRLFIVSRSLKKSLRLNEWINMLTSSVCVCVCVVVCVWLCVCVCVCVCDDTSPSCLSSITPSDGWIYEYAADFCCWQLERLGCRVKKYLLPVWDKTFILTVMTSDNMRYFFLTRLICAWTSCWSGFFPLVSALDVFWHLAVWSPCAALRWLAVWQQLWLADWSRWEN